MNTLLLILPGAIILIFAILQNKKLSRKQFNRIMIGIVTVIIVIVIIYLSKASFSFSLV